MKTDPWPPPMFVGGVHAGRQAERERIVEWLRSFGKEEFKKRYFDHQLGLAEILASDDWNPDVPCSDVIFKTWKKQGL